MFIIILALVKFECELLVEDYRHIGVTFNHFKNETSMDDYCESHGDWAALTRRMYFHKKTAYHFTDLQLIVLNFLMYSSHWAKFKIVLNITLPSGVSYLKDDVKFVKYVDGKQEHNYRYHTLVGHFDHFNTSMSIEVQIIDRKSQQSLRRPLRLMSKDTNFHRPDRKSGTLGCVKHIFLKSEQNFYNLKVWLRLQRYVGFDRIVSYQMPDTIVDESRIKFIDQNRHFLELKNHKCIPNIVANDARNDPLFMRSYQNSKDVYDTLVIMGFLSINQCIFENIDRYKYIGVFDYDELFIPSSGSTEINIERFVGNSSLLLGWNDINYGENALKRFLESQINPGLFGQTRSVEFYQKPFLEYKIIDTMCAKLKSIDENVGYFGRTLRLKHATNDPFGLEKYRTIWLRISNVEEYRYGMYLCAINDQIRSLTENDSRREASIFNRFFALGSHVTVKSIYSTNSTLTVKFHTPVLQFSPTSDGKFYVAQIDRSYFIPDGRRPGYYQGFLAHFRPDSTYYMKDKTYDITQITVDLSYMELFNRALLDPV